MSVCANKTKQKTQKTTSLCERFYGISFVPAVTPVPPRRRDRPEGHGLQHQDKNAAKEPSRAVELGHHYVTRHPPETKGRCANRTSADNNSNKAVSSVRGSLPRPRPAERKARERSHIHDPMSGASLEDTGTWTTSLLSSRASLRKGPQCCEAS